MTKKAVIALLGCVFALSLALVGCSSGGGAASSAAPTEADMKAEFAGSWELTGGTSGGEEMSADSLALMKQMGLSITLELTDDGTGTLGMMGESIAVEWSVSSMTEGKLTNQGESVPMSLADGKLTLTDGDETMTFERVTATAGSSGAAAESSSASADESSSAAADESSSSSAAA